MDKAGDTRHPTLS